ncbi:hypothetical protein [Leptodesmis sichuanensis]|uniref:hypothetical protein n=1 Tax=Leptodesmis sichuanensis TaxID=2906798 RepID=UPI001F35D836|nr:hypothetical protein [Leptodesmis sichuanensis]UIE39632.1 hypothetical protein KIK02_08775 [Leptodesmis sichuanensis A121]
MNVARSNRVARFLKYPLCFQMMLNYALALSAAALILLSGVFNSLSEGWAASIQANYLPGLQGCALQKVIPGVGATRSTIKIFFIGNSGTDELGDGAEPLLASAGYRVEQQKFSIPGAPLSYLWHFQNSAGRDKSPLALMQKMQPDHLTIMPIYRSAYSDPNEQNTVPVSPDYLPEPDEKNIPEPGDVRIGALFYSYALRANPNVKLWLYSVWPDNQDPRYQTAAQWDAWVRNRQAENEKTRTGIDKVSDGKPIGIIPAGSGFAYLREQLGQSQQQFIAEHFQDGIHLNATGRYFVGLLYYAAVTGQPPTEKVTANGPLPAALATQYKQIAWDVISGYQWAQ